jgi:hypothetical protein
MTSSIPNEKSFSTGKDKKMGEDVNDSLHFSLQACEKSGQGWPVLGLL